MFGSVPSRFHAILLGFMLLIAGTVGAASLGANVQNRLAAGHALTARQQSLIHQVRWLAISQPDSAELARARERFDDGLHDLRDGGMLQNSIEREIGQRLDKVAESWGAFSRSLQAGNTAKMEATASTVIAELELVSELLQREEEVTAGRIRALQSVSLLFGLSLTVLGFYLSRGPGLRSSRPLVRAAHRIGQGDLGEPVPAVDEKGLEELASALEMMRTKLAISRQELEHQVARRTDELITALEFSQEIVAQFDLDRLLSSVLERAQALMQAEKAALCLLTEDGDYLERAASSESAAVGVTQKLSVSPLSAGNGSREVSVTDACCTTCDFLDADFPGRCLSVPLQVGERTIGALCVIRPGHVAAQKAVAFAANERRALSLLANSAAIAIANVRLAEESRRQAGRTAALAERERLVAELHDNLAQTLSFLNLKAERIEELLIAGATGNALEELAIMHPAIDTAHLQVRAMLTGLQSSLWRDGDELSQKLASSVVDFRERTGVPAELILSERDELHLPQVTQNQVLHIVREALANVARHAQARKVSVRAERSNGTVRFLVRDDGRGFDPGAVDRNKHLGLTIMRTRAERSGGQLTIHAAPGEGTEVVASFPLRRAGNGRLGE